MLRRNEIGMKIVSIAFELKQPGDHSHRPRNSLDDHTSLPRLLFTREALYEQLEERILKLNELPRLRTFADNKYWLHQPGESPLKYT